VVELVDTPRYNRGDQKWL